MLNYDISSRHNQTKTIWLYERIKEDILSGALSPGDRLPSKRDLSQHLGISIMTIENALFMLEEEGFLKAVPRSGFFVQAAAPHGSRALSAFRIDPLTQPESISHDQLPVQGLGKLMRKILNDHPDILLRKPPHQGCAILRNAIASYLLRFRGMQVQPQNILIGSGAEYLYGMIVQLLGRERQYGIEYPSYAKIEQVYLANGALVERLAMGKDGIREDVLEKTRASVLHVSPFHSFPTGITASAKKRFSYLSWAQKHNALIVEDDFDSEFTFFRKPLETLYALDTGQSVLYMNTFSKSIGPGVRIAYLVLPDSLMDLYEQNLGFYSCTVPVFDQYVLAEFIDSGGFERHLGRVRRAYLS